MTIDQQDAPARDFSGSLLTRRAALALAGAALATGPAQAAPPRGPGVIRLPATVTPSELRGLSATGKTYWASGSKGWLVRGKGARLEAVRAAGFEALDFRGLHAFSDTHVLAMSAGPGEASQLWRTTDGGETWARPFANSDPNGFWDTLTFVDKRRGFILGDPTEGRFTVLYTDNAGETWTRLPPDAVPPAHDGEGAFAASNGCLAVGPKGLVAFCTGGGGWARVYLSRDGGRYFHPLDTPIRADAPSRGAFAVAFGGNGALWVCGGDYKEPAAAGVNLAWLAPNSRTFQAVAAPPGYLSGLAVRGSTVLATGLAGSIVAVDGQTFERVSTTPFNTARLINARKGLLCGPKGSIGLWEA